MARTISSAPYTEPTFAETKASKKELNPSSPRRNLHSRLGTRQADPDLIITPPTVTAMPFQTVTVSSLHEVSAEATSVSAP